MPIEPANANIISLKVVFDRKKPIILSTLYTDQSFKVNLRYAPQNPFKYYWRQCLQTIDRRHCLGFVIVSGGREKK